MIKNKSSLKFILVIMLTVLIFTGSVVAQNVGINSTGALPNAASVLDIEANGKGLLIPRITLAQRTIAAQAGGLLDAGGLLPAAAQGLLVYQTDGLEGFYYNISTTTTPFWYRISGDGSLNWTLQGNTGTVPGTDYLGTSDAKDLIFKSNTKEIMRLTSGGRLGIGEASADAFLEVSASGANPTDDILMVSSQDNANGDYLIIKKDGLTGIGFNAPTTRLEVLGGATGIETNVFQVRSNFGTANTATAIQFVNSSTSGAAAGSAEIAALRTVVGGNSNLIFRTHNGTAVNEAVRIMDNGDVGIGTASPSNMLELNAGTSTSRDAAISFQTNSVNNYTLGIDNTNDHFKLSNALALGTTDVIDVSTTGVGIFEAPSGEALEVFGDVEFGGGATGKDGSDETIKIRAQSNNWFIGVRNLATAANSDFHIGLTSAQDGIFHIQPDGFIGMGTISPKKLLHIDGGDLAVVGAGELYTNIPSAGVNDLFSAIDDNKWIINAYATGTAGGAGFFKNSNVANANPVIDVKNSGTGQGVLITSLGTGEPIKTQTNTASISALITNTKNAASSVGVYGQYNGASTSGCIGVYGIASLAGGGNGTGVRGEGGFTGVYGKQIAGGTYAGYFSGTTKVFGNLIVTGSVTKGSGTFLIDHPNDPENKYLYHSFVESPDMMNIYNGNIITDVQGVAEVTLPDYFQTLNMDYRYQLTVVGQFAQAIVLKEVQNNKFVIQTDIPNVKVSWQVTGVRNDPYAQKNRVIPVVEKDEKDKGKYLYPEVYGQPTNKRIGYEEEKRAEGNHKVIIEDSKGKE